MYNKELSSHEGRLSSSVDVFKSLLKKKKELIITSLQIIYTPTDHLPGSHFKDIFKILFSFFLSFKELLFLFGSSLNETCTDWNDSDLLQKLHLYKFFH